jgi:hypothetical protein
MGFDLVAVLVKRLILLQRAAQVEFLHALCIALVYRYRLGLSYFAMELAQYFVRFVTLVTLHLQIN